MTKNRLNIIQVSSEKSEIPQGRKARLSELEAKFERLWLVDPEQFNPLRNSIQKERLDRTWDLLTQFTTLKDKKIVDLGCGSGVFSRRMRDGGGDVTAADIADNALKHFTQFNQDNITTIRETVPYTNLPDEHYDIVAAMDLIAELPPDDYRLFFAELARLIKPNGYLLCSSPLDIDTQGGAERLIHLAQTEFDILGEKKSYHALQLRLKRLLETPANYLEAWRSPAWRKEELARRAGLTKWVYGLNTTFVFMWLWAALTPLAQPLLSLLKNNRWLMLRLEGLCEFLWNEEGASHIAFVAKRRPIVVETEPEEIPLERPRKKEIWE